MSSFTGASFAPTGPKTTAKELVVRDLEELEFVKTACERFDEFLWNIKYDDESGQVATNSSIRERKICTLKDRLRDFVFTVSETIEQVKRDNKKLFK